MALLQDQVTVQESRFFFRRFLLLDDFQHWRKTEKDFVCMDAAIPGPTLSALKRELAALYPEFGRQFAERLQSDLGGQYKYADASLHIYGLWKKAPYNKLTLMQRMCLGFLCPDHEFKSKLTEFVYTQLSDVFEFSEEYSRLHQFLRRAAWKMPVAVLAVSHVNVVNTLASVAQHYGVGLDVVRSDPEAESLLQEQRSGKERKADALIRRNLLDNTAICMMSDEQQYAKLLTAATNLVIEGNVCTDPQAPLHQLNYTQTQ